MLWNGVTMLMTSKNPILPLQLGQGAWGKSFMAP